MPRSRRARHIPSEELNRLGRQYSEQVIPRHIRPKALKRIQWHKSEGDKVVIVSASLDVYLKYWCEKFGVELISDNQGP